MGMWHVWVERKATYRCFMGKCEGKRPLGRQRNMWEGTSNESSRKRMEGRGMD